MSYHCLRLDTPPGQISASILDHGIHHFCLPEHFFSAEERSLNSDEIHKVEELASLYFKTINESQTICDFSDPMLILILNRGEEQSFYTLFFSKTLECKEGTIFWSPLRDQESGLDYFINVRTLPSPSLSALLTSILSCYHNFRETPGR
jgi:hypothetical protein